MEVRNDTGRQRPYLTTTFPRSGSWDLESDASEMQKIHTHNYRPFSGLEQIVHFWSALSLLKWLFYLGWEVGPGVILETHAAKRQARVWFILSVQGFGWGCSVPRILAVPDPCASQGSQLPPTQGWGPCRGAGRQGPGPQSPLSGWITLEF